MDEDQVEPLALDELVEPLDPDEARKLILAILEDGRITLVTHARERMNARDLGSVDIANVLRAGVVEFPEHDNKSKEWRYRVCTNRMTVVIEFRSKDHLVVITAWRN